MTTEAKVNRQAEWDQKIEQVKTFSEANKRWPSTTSKDETEKALAQWWSRQKYMLRKIQEGEKIASITPERQKALQEIVDNNSSLERDGVWNTRFDLIANKFKADSKLWAYASTNEDEQKSLRWWNQQKTFARKFKTSTTPIGGMTQARYDKVAGLMRVMGQDPEAEPAVATDPSTTV